MNKYCAAPHHATTLKANAPWTGQTVGTAEKQTSGAPRNGCLHARPTNPKTQQVFSYPRDKRGCLFGRPCHGALELSVSTDKPDYSSRHKYRTATPYRRDAPGRTAAAALLPTALHNNRLKKAFSSCLDFPSESHNYPNNSTHYAPAICKWKTETLFVKTGKLKQTGCTTLFAQSEGETPSLPPQAGSTL